MQWSLLLVSVFWRVSDESTWKISGIIYEIASVVLFIVYFMFYETFFSAKYPYVEIFSNFIESTIRVQNKVRLERFCRKCHITKSIESKKNVLETLISKTKADGWIATKSQIILKIKYALSPENQFKFILFHLGERLQNPQ